jgi:hypothetical protein
VMNGTCKEQEENKFDFRQNELGTSIIETKHMCLGRASLRSLTFSLPIGTNL